MEKEKQAGERGKKWGDKGDRGEKRRRKPATVCLYLQTAISDRPTIIPSLIPSIFIILSLSAFSSPVMIQTFYLLLQNTYLDVSPGL